MTKAYDLLTSLIPRLEAIRTANGYATDAGASVLMGALPKQTGEVYPYCRLHEVDAAPESIMPHRPTAKMRTQFLAEIFAEEPDPLSLVKTGHMLIGDLKKALFGDESSDMRGAAIDARLEGYRIIAPVPGGDIVLAQVRGSYSFTDHFDTP